MSNGKELIEWIVLDELDGTALLISKYALDCQEYHTAFSSVTWETSSLREWLNGTFLSAAFSEEERAMIPSVSVSADKNPSSNTSPGNSTTDQVFLLSITEADNYFSSDETRKCAPTAYAIEQGAWTNKEYKVDGKATCWWWLRSLGTDSDNAAHVRSDGFIDDFGNAVFYSDGAVRPALWVNLGSTVKPSAEPPTDPTPAPEASVEVFAEQTPTPTPTPTPPMNLNATDTEEESWIEIREMEVLNWNDDGSVTVMVVVAYHLREAEGGQLMIMSDYNTDTDFVSLDTDADTFISQGDGIHTFGFTIPRSDKDTFHIRAYIHPFPRGDPWKPIATSESVAIRSSGEEVSALYEETKASAESSGMRLVADNGKLLVACRDSELWVVLGGLVIKDSYIINEDGVASILEYAWKVSFSDGSSNYEVSTTSWRFDPGKNTPSTIDRMQHSFWVDKYNKGNASMKHDETSIIWKLRVPEDVKIDFDKVSGFDISVVDHANIILSEKGLH